MYYPLPAPIVLGMCGGILGLLAGGFNNSFAVWVGAVTGGSIGCIGCIVHVAMIEPPRPAIISSDPIIIQNIYISGSDKIPIANNKIEPVKSGMTDTDEPSAS